MSDELVRVERPDPPAEIGVSIIKGALGAVPVVDQALMEALFDCRSRIKQERINNYFQDIANELRSQVDVKIDLEYLETEEFSDLLEDILLKVAISRNETKRKHFKNLLMQAIKGNRPPDISRTFINALDEITEAELVLLSHFYDVRVQSLKLQEKDKEADPYVKCPKGESEIFGITRSQYLLMVQSLIRKGLLCDDSGGRFDSNPYDVIGINELGMQFYEYITHV